MFKRSKNVFFVFSSGVYANPDDRQWPTLDQVKTPKVKVFRNLGQQDAFLIVDFEKVKEEYRGRTIENLYLTLREKDESVLPFKCRVSTGLKRSLKDQNLYKMFKTHQFFVTNNGERQSRKCSRFRYNDYSILVRAKVNSALVN